MLERLSLTKGNGCDPMIYKLLKVNSTIVVVISACALFPQIIVMY